MVATGNKLTRDEIIFVVARVCAAALAFWALGENPLSFYAFLRWVVCLTSCFGFYLALKKSASFQPYLFGIAAVLWNPVFRIHLSRDLWHVADLVLGASFAISVVMDFARRDRQPG